MMPRTERKSGIVIQSEMMLCGQVTHRTIAVLSAGALGVVLGGCAVRRELPTQDLSLGQRLAVRPCDEDGARVELVGARPDSFHYKPSIDVDHYLMDLRARSDAERWLIIDQDTAPSGVDSVSKEEQGNGWWLGELHAHFIHRAGDLTVNDLRVGVGKDGKLSAVLARISVDSMKPQRWVEEGRQVDHRSAFGGKLVPLAIDVDCVSWFDVHAPPHAASP
jgi:hypothetical protein